MTRARVSIGLLVGLAATPMLPVAQAEVTHKARRSMPARTIQAAPDVTSTIAKPGATGPTSMGPEPGTSADVPQPAEDLSIPPPFTLPQTSRTRMRACGTQWRDMKLAGATGDDDWRDFAMRCFVDDRPQAPPR